MQHSRTGTFSGHFLDGTAEIQIQDVRMCGFNDDFSRFCDGSRIATVDLNDHRALIFADGQFGETFVHHTHQRVGGHKFGIDHRSPQSPTEQTEANVGDIFHRGQKDGMCP